LILPDVNVLLYAFRNDYAQHPRHRAWLESLIDGDEPFAMSPQVLGAVIRIATNKRIYRQPAQFETALDFAGTLLAEEHCRIVLPGPRHWRIFVRLCQDARARGDLIQNAWFAALAIEHDCEWITHDRDYGRFPGLRWRPPF
jgi:toxin-antitoxin system PIN domain toxin